MKKSQQPSKVTHARELAGVVIRKSGIKTVAVEVVRVIPHGLYDKRVKRTKRYLVHDESDTTEVGSNVLIRQSRPLSARKRWIIVPKGNTK